ncbi:MAG: hypothetical protein DCF20_20065 [Pseudanabaena sp.]|nr:MAG: hypothetical protein DCF20_20065 [Pseudanabaena sp.]
MKKLHLILLSLPVFWFEGQAMQALSAPQPCTEVNIEPTLMTKGSNPLTVTDLAEKPLLGQLGQPLGKIITISGVVRQEAFGAKASPKDVLSVEYVNNCPLAVPVTIEFNLFVTAQVAKPVLGRSFKYVGYETGGFTGTPQEAFKFVPAVATTGYRFNTSFQVLQEELDVVKTKTDLAQFNNRRVQVIGRYVSHSRPAPAITSSIDFKGNYTTAKIVLEDGTEVPIYLTYLKQSLRSPEEVKAYDGKIVKVVGQISFDRDQKLNPNQSITLTTFDGIWQYQSKF